MEFEEMWKLEDKLNKEKEIEQVSREEIEEKARGIRKGLAQVYNLFQVSTKISIKLTRIRHTSVLSLRHGKNSGKGTRNPCFLRLKYHIAGMDFYYLYINY
jgi:hypothetical protein